MKLTFRARHLDLGPDLADQLRRRVHFGLGRLATAIRSVEVTIIDVNGPKGGLDKRCTILVTVGGGDQVIARGIDADFYAAIGKAVATLKRLVGRRLQRGHAKQRGGG